VGLLPLPSNLIPLAPSCCAFWLFEHGTQTANLVWCIAPETSISSWSLSSQLLVLIGPPISTPLWNNGCHGPKTKIDYVKFLWRCVCASLLSGCVCVSVLATKMFLAVFLKSILRGTICSICFDLCLHTKWKWAQEDFHFRMWFGPDLIEP